MPVVDELSPEDEQQIKQQWQPIMGDDFEIVVNIFTSVLLANK